MRFFRHPATTLTTDAKLDHWVALLLTPLAFWILLNGLDDCIIDVAAALAWLRHRSSTHPDHKAPTDEELAAAPARRMAVFVAVWKEHRVIQKMIDNNVTRLHYPRFDFFVGAYPNDGPTVTAVREAMKRHSNVHLSVCPHDGPTSKADCLNWIYQRMMLHEEEHGLKFDMILTHDAEDLMDPDALTWINYYAQWHDMVQIPVLALPTPLREVSHGVYCDEFCEYQHKDMMARAYLGGFIPSSGVGTGFSRRALEMLAAAHANRIFEPGCLTEDYENGFRIARLGLSQKFVPVQVRHGRAIATREFFPRRFSPAIRQRSRWITGISLQSWEFHDFRETMQYLYWFWRDRKSVVNNLVGPLTNVFFVYGAATLAWAITAHRPWGLGHEAAWLAAASVAGLSLQVLHTLIRIGCCSRIYGWPFALAAPLRMVAGNWINCLATCRAISTYTSAKLRGKPLRWAKTDHAYPNRTSLLTDRKRLGEILAGGQWIVPAQLEAALASQPPTRRLGEHLLHLGLITESDLYAALALQNNLPMGKPEPSSVSVAVTRSLPSDVSLKWHVLPFRIAAGELYVAGSEIPDDAMHGEIRKFSSLEIRFQLVTPSEYQELADQYLK